MATEIYEEIELVNIISVSQMRLKKNFSVIASKLSQQESMIKVNANTIEQSKIELKQLMVANQQKCFGIVNELKKQVEDLRKLVGQLSNNKGQLNTNLMGFKRIMEQNQQQCLDKIFELQERFGMLNDELKLQNTKIEQLEKGQVRINDQLTNKENRVDVEKLDKKVQEVTQANNFINNELKLAEHKIQKIELFSQKAQRLHIKKQAELFKEIDQRIKKQLRQLKVNKQSPINPTTHSNPKNIIINKVSKVSVLPSEQNRIQVNSSKDSENQEFNGEIPLQQRSSMIFTMEQEDGALRTIIKSCMNENLGKLTEKIKKLEIQHKQLMDNLKASKNENKKDNNLSGGQSLKEKINQIRPELVKMWAKVEAIEDKMYFSEKKFQEKSKVINDIMVQQKENSSIGRIEEKFKVMQGDIYASIKEIKAKIQMKLSTSDYQAFVNQLDDKLKILNETISMKSQKLQVKKALLFLQSKIKEIILVISEEEENQKDALLTRKQIKCISCDKEMDKFSGLASTHKQNWDSLPFKDHPPEMLGRFGMTNYGSLSKKLKRLDNKDLPILKTKNNSQVHQPNLSP